jgi:8-oxo-dGTP pyrophosphatase MutT (NUDIX family)
MEFFDVLDENRNKLGYTKQRGETLEENEFNVGVEFWIFNNKKVLMTKRSPLKSHPGQWEVPGGCSQAGETSFDTLVREAKEEVNITVKDNDFKLVGTQMYKKQFVDVYKSNVEVDVNNIILQEEEVSDVKFVSKEEFLKMGANDEIVQSVYNRYNNLKDELDKEW